MMTMKTRGRAELLTALSRSPISLRIVSPLKTLLSLFIEDPRVILAGVSGSLVVNLLLTLFLLGVKASGSWMIFSSSSKGHITFSFLLRLMRFF